MSTRDDWQLDWRTRYTDQREQDRFRSDRSLPFLRPEDRDDHRRQLDESQGSGPLHTLAYSALIGAGAYIGLKHFSSAHLQRAKKAMSSALDSVKGRASKESTKSSILDKLGRMLGRQTEVEARAGKTILDKQMAEDVQTAFSIFSAESGIIGDKSMVVRSLLERYQSSHPLHKPLRDMPNQIRDLVNLQGFRSTAGRMGINVELAARQLGSAATQTNFTLGQAARWATSARIPFLGWKPLELLAPTGFLTKGPSIGRLAKQNIPGASDKVVEGLFAGGGLYAMEDHMVGRTTYKRIREEVLGTGYRMGLSSSGMGKGAMARMGVGIARPLEDILKAQPELGVPLKPGQGFWDIITGKAGTETILDRLRRVSLEAGERYGIGPQFSERRGLIPGFAEAVRTTATHQGVRIRELGNQAYGRIDPDHPIESKIRELIGKKLGSIAEATAVEDLTWLEKLKIRLGKPPHRLIATQVGDKVTYEKQAIAEFLDRKGKNLRRTVPLTERTFKSKHYAYKGVKQGLGDWFNYHLNRPTWLMNEMIGIGLKPGKGPMESLWNLGTRVVLPAYMGYQALQYAEYKSRKYFGYGPISGPAAVYTEGRAAVQEMLDKTGVTEKALELEEQFPGALESPFSKATAAMGGTFGGAMAGRRLGGPKGALLGTLLGAAAGFTVATGVTTEADELREMYKGERDVPVRADRWWFLGRQPYGGGRIKYWKKHWFAEMTSNYRDKAIYGSKKEAWRGSWLPTPENLFLLKNIYDPYYVENLHYHDRPYPTTSPMFGEVPLVGGALQATIGRLLKPVQYRHTTVPDSQGIPQDALRGQQEAALMGTDPYEFEQRPSKTRMALSEMTLETVHRLFDWTGLPGFMAESALGMEDWGRDDQVLAASGIMTSSEKAYYEKNAGGMLGGTELLRRFMPRSRRKSFINPIENIAPEWLPGHRSVFPGDRAGHLNFHRGDPYTILEKGEGRLPGKGYEELHGLHSSEPGVYDSFDRFKILSDIAPFSEAFKHYKTEVQQQIEGGVLSKHDTDRYYKTIDNMDERTRSRTAAGGKRYSSGAFDTAKVRIARALDPTTFQVSEMPGVTFQLAGVTDRTHQMSASQLSAYKTLGSKMRSMVGKEVEMTWGGAGVETPAIIGNVNQIAIDAGLQTEQLHGLGYQAKHGGGGLPSLYENAMHAGAGRLPGPLMVDYFRTKWLGQRTATEEYEFSYKHGGQSTDWGHPFSNYILPWFHSATNSEAAQANKARQLTEYMDNLKYAKNTKLANQAIAAGNTELAQSYAQRASQTLVSLRANSPNFWRDVYAALPPAERPYFNVFAGTTGREEQERIMEAVPEYMKHIYMGLWQRKQPRDQFDSPILKRYSENARRASSQSVDEQVAEFFTSHPAPPKDWMGWHPGVDLESVTIRTANQEGVDIHQLGMWESQQLAASAYSEVPPIELEANWPWDKRDNVVTELDKMGFEALNDGSHYSDEEEEMQIRLLRRKADRFRAMTNPFSTARSAGGRFV